MTAFILACILLAILLFYRFYFLRSPERVVPNDDTLFVSPANGKIIAILNQDELREGENKLYKENKEVIDDRTAGFWSGATLISIVMTPLDVHYQKAPLASKLIQETYEEGRFFNAMKSNDTMKSTFQNEYNSMLFQTPENYQFRIIQIAGFVARRIVDFMHIGQEVKQGEKIWLIKLGSQVSIVLDKNFEILAQTGDLVVDGETILARKK